MNTSFHNNTNMGDSNSGMNDKIPSPEEIRNAILKKLVDSGEKDRLKEMLSDRLTQSGWRDDLKEHCKNIIRRKGLEKITVEELVSEITPYGRSTVPNEVKSELLDRIRAFLHVENGDDNNDLTET